MRSLAILAALPWVSLSLTTPNTGRLVHHENGLAARALPVEIPKDVDEPGRSKPVPAEIPVEVKGGAGNQKVDPKDVALQKASYPTNYIRVYTEKPDIKDPNTQSGLHVDENREVSVIVGNDMPNQKAAIKADAIESGLKGKQFTTTSKPRSFQRRAAAILRSKGRNQQQTTSVATQDKDSVVNPISSMEQAQYDRMIALATKLGETVTPVLVADAQDPAAAPGKQPTLASLRTSKAMGWLNARISRVSPTVKIQWRGRDGNPSVIDPNVGSQTKAQRRALLDLRDQQERRSVLTDVSTGGGNTTTSDASTEFQLYFTAFQILQRNISDAIFPILVDMTTGHSSSLVYNAAWSIWADLTGASEQVKGPFSTGQHCFDFLEDQYAQQNNVTENDVLFQDYLAVNSVLIDLYTSAWSASVTAANATGWLSQITMLASNMLTNETSVQTPGFDSIDPNSYNDRFYTFYNQAMAQT